MKTKIKITIGIAIILALGYFSYVVFAPNNQKLGNLNVNENAYSSGVSYSTTTVGTVAVKLLVRATSSRTFAKFCNMGASIVYLYKQSTSTGIARGMGSPLFATSSYNGSCITYDEIDPYLGDFFSIAEASTTVAVESLQN